MIQNAKKGRLDPGPSSEVSTAGASTSHTMPQAAAGEPPRRIVGPVEVRLAARLAEDENGCHVWTGARSPSGYGHIAIGGRVRNVHRVAYELHVGPIPPGLVLDHLCRNRACANPAHLEPVTSGENTRRGEPAQRTHCPRGHAYDETNTYRTRTGGRACRACKRELQRIYDAKRKNKEAS